MRATTCKINNNKKIMCERICVSAGRSMSIPLIYYKILVLTQLCEFILNCVLACMYNVGNAIDELKMTHR